MEAFPYEQVGSGGHVGVATMSIAKTPPSRTIPDPVILPRSGARAASPTFRWAGLGCASVADEVAANAWLR